MADGADKEPTILGEGAGVHLGSADDDEAIDFGSFLLSLAHNALVAMGLVEHPELGEVAVDLESARQSIQIIEMLRDKTRGNLDPDEEKLIGGVLYDLRMSYVDATK